MEVYRANHNAAGPDLPPTEGLPFKRVLDQVLASPPAAGYRASSAQREASNRSAEARPRAPTGSTPKAPTNEVTLETYFKSKFPGKIAAVTRVADNGLIYGTFSDGALFEGDSLLGRIDVKTGRVLYTFRQFEDAIAKAKIGKIQSVNDDGILHGERGFARIDLANGKVKWTTDDSYSGFGDLSSAGNWSVRNQRAEVQFNPNTGYWMVKTEFINEPYLTKLGGKAAHQVLYSNNKTSTWQIVNRERGTGKVLWKSDIPQSLGDVRFVTTDGTVLTEKGLARLDDVSGSPIFTAFHPSNFGGFKRLRAGNVFEYDGGFVRLNQNTGKILWAKKSNDMPGMEKGSGNSILDFAPGELGTRIALGNGDAIFIDDNGKNFKMSDHPDIIEQLRKFNIDAYNRLYGPEFAQHIIRMRTLLEDAQLKPNATPTEVEREVSAAGELNSKPIAVIFSAHSDWNGAFRFNNNDEFVRAYNVIYFELANDHEVEQALRSLAYAQLRPDILVIMGHGSPTGIRLSDDPSATPTSNSIDQSDSEMLKHYNEVFTGSTIVLDSCSTGRVKNVNGRNMVQIIADSIGERALSITGPKIDTNDVKLFYPNGKFKGVEYFGDDDVAFTITHQSR